MNVAYLPLMKRFFKIYINYNLNFIDTIKILNYILQMKYLDKVKKASNYIKKRTGLNLFNIAVIFGSGLSPSEEMLKGKVIPYEDIPFFPKITVKGHKSRLISININNRNVLFFLGRLHYYEGYSPLEVTFPIRIMKELGVRVLLITNAAGAIDTKYKPGDLMLIRDHINFTGNNPLIGPNIDEHGVRFVDMLEPYSKRLINIIKKSNRIKFREGVYIGVTGPTYESAAEIKFYRSIGGNAVGMSTVFEAIVANHCSIETAGISCIVNAALDVTKENINHEKILSISKMSESKLLNIVKNFVGML